MRRMRALAITVCFLAAASSAAAIDAALESRDDNLYLLCPPDKDVFVARVLETGEIEEASVASLFDMRDRVATLETTVAMLVAAVNGDGNTNGLKTNVQTLMSAVTTPTSGLVDRIASIEGSLNGASGLTAVVTKLQQDVGTPSSDGLLSRVANLKGVVSDNQDSLSKQVQQLSDAVNGAGNLNGIEARLGTVEQLATALDNTVGDANGGLVKDLAAATAVLMPLPARIAVNEKYRYTMMGFGHDPTKGVIYYGDPLGVRHEIPTSLIKAEDGLQKVGKLAYDYIGENKQPTYYFDISGAVSISCSIISSEDDLVPNWVWRFATDGGNGFSNVWGGSTWTLAAVMHSVECNTGQCSDKHPYLMQTWMSFQIICFK